MTEQPPDYPPPPGDYPPPPGGYPPPPGGYPPPQPGGYGYQPPPPPPGYGYPPSVPGYGYPPPPSSTTNPMAIASLVSSLLGWICGIGPILGIVFGVIALNQIKKTGQGGRGLALAGTIIGGVGVAFILLYLVFVVIFAASHSGDSNAAADLINLGRQAFSGTASA